MRFQWKVVTLVTTAVAIMASIVIWRTHAVVVADKMNFVTDSSVKQIAPLKRLIDAKLGEAQNELVRFAASRAVSGPGRETNFGPFDVIALVEASAGAPVASWTERGATAKTDSWPYGHDLTLLKSLPYAKVRDGQRHWVRVADGKGGPVFAVIVPVEVKAAEAPPSVPTQGTLPEAVGANPPPQAPAAKTRAFIVGFSTQNPLASITEDFIGSITNVYVVDDRGYVASHVDKTYNGALFTEDPMVAEILKTQKGIGGGNFEDLESRPVIGHYERVSDSNLTAIISVPIRAATVGADDHLQTAIFTALGVTLLAALLSWFAGGLLTPPTSGPVIDLGASGLRAALVEDDESLQPMKPLAPLAPVAPPAPPVAAVTDASLQNERKLAYESFQEGMARQLREPVLSILGHAQLIRANASPDDPIQAHVESIERDARNAKESLDRMRFFEQTEEPLGRDETFDLDDVVTKTLEEKAVDLQAAGVIVDRNLGQVPRLHGRASDVAIALGHMIDNAIEAMRERPVRRLTVKTENRGDVAALAVADTGIGMSRDVKNRAFEPFFKAFQSPLRMGLGLSFVHAVANRTQAECEIASVPGDGTTITMKFPLETAAVEATPPPTELEEAVEEFQVMKPKMPPPPSQKLTLGGRGPIGGADGLPPMPYPKLDREDELSEMPELPATEELPLADATEEIVAAPPTVSEVTPVREEVEPPAPEDSTVQFNFAARHDFAPPPIETPPVETPSDEPEPMATESIPTEPIGEAPPIEAAPTPPPTANGPRPFRVRIRPPKTRGPNSQA